jgi:hypothetical protein
MGCASSKERPNQPKVCFTHDGLVCHLLSGTRMSRGTVPMHDGPPAFAEKIKSSENQAESHLKRGYRLGHHAAAPAAPAHARCLRPGEVVVEQRR